MREERKTAIRRISPLAFPLALTVSWLACQKGPELTERQENGRRIYEGLCDKCHALIDPGTLSDQAWVAASGKYGTQLKLTRDEISALQDYLTRANDTEKKD